MTHKAFLFGFDPYQHRREDPVGGDQGGGVGDFQAAALAALELPSNTGPSRPSTGAAPVWLAGGDFQSTLFVI